MDLDGVDERFRAALCGVKSLSLEWKPVARNFESMASDPYITALISSPSLRTIRVNLASTEHDHRERGGCASATFLSAITTDEIAEFSLRCAKVRQSDLEHVFRRLGSGPMKVSLRAVKLTEGEWDPAVNMLRMRTTTASEKRTCRVGFGALTNGGVPVGLSLDYMCNWPKDDGSY